MKIFISYAHTDLPRVQKLADILRFGGHDIWFDQRLVGGQSWKAQLANQIKGSDCFLYALTPESVGSAWCQWEFAQAVHMGKKIATVLLAPCQLTGVLNDHQYVDFTQGDTIEAGLRLGTAVFAAQVIRPELVPLLPEPYARPERPVVDSSGHANRAYEDAYQAFRDGDYQDASDLLALCLEIMPGHRAAGALLKRVERRLHKQTAPPRVEVSAPTAPDRKPAPPGVPDILPEPFEWCAVPAGPFLMGSDPAKDPTAQDNEQPQVTIELPAFYIAKYPVTNAQYGRFIEAGGYENAEWWTDTGWQVRQKQNWQQPRYWQNKKWNGERQPVVGVSWYEAYAFGRWLSEAARLPIMLPDEVQWEKAARGPDGRIYPWGNEPPTEDRCNFGKHVGRTTPVTQYPHGASPYGALDMSGNVWEWCLTKWGWAYSDGRATMDNTPEGSGSRVLRGGAFFNLVNGGALRLSLRLGSARL
jgi:formylglycine-generating enzyme required for sulfatase activity